MQERQSLGIYFLGEKICASCVTTRPGKVGDKTELNGVFADTEYNRNGRGRSLGGDCNSCAAGRGDHSYMAADQISGQRCHTIISALQPVVLDYHVLAFDVAGFAQPLTERGRNPRPAFGRPTVNKADHGDGRLLRPRRNRPCRRTAEKGDEIAPADHSITSSARAMRVGGKVRPMALAALRLITSSNLVAFSTGSSPTLAPRRMRSTRKAVRRQMSIWLAPYDMSPPSAANSLLLLIEGSRCSTASRRTISRLASMGVGGTTISAPFGCVPNWSIARTRSTPSRYPIRIVCTARAPAALSMDGKK